ncbi:ABC transporter substrate-binding protein [Microbacter margulisiae]|uniref:Iron complex transport system substrate-binding protein n=1 Tax=Microbacter margulisiae TaxID=1350067 RepID=A0A7W5DT03_9PORP|nr:ABC transporter substrate-binding protein [Microbacter margulisiae]MBB3188049.1 iron complex transport system substrate-binding protein [Microbacter margulisiae]
MATFAFTMGRRFVDTVLAYSKAPVWLVFIAILFISCHSHSGPSSAESSQSDSSAVIQYAHGFAIDYFSNYTRLTVFNPWRKSEIEAVYYLVSRRDIHTPDARSTILVPVHSLAATSCTHIAFLEALHQLSALTGMASPELVYSSAFQQLSLQGKMIDLGDPLHLNIEKILKLHPQLVLMTNYNQVNVAADQLIQAGVPIVYENEWMESTPLGRAEWIKFIAAFFQKGHMADSIFNSLTKNYMALKQLAHKAQHTPTVLVGNNFKGTWYVPSGTGYMGQFLADAKCNYYFSNDTTTGSIPLNFEQALEYFKDADVWLNCSSNSLTTLQNSDPRYQLFKAFRNKEVYSLNGRTTSLGGNDFWESGVIHPDILLRDYIRVLHPALLPHQPLIYVLKLKE